MAAGRGVVRRWGTAALAAGLLVMVWAGLQAVDLRPSWFDPGDGPACAGTPDGCPADVDAALTGLWWVLAAGGAVALVGLVLVVAGLPVARRTAPTVVHPLARAGLIGLVGGAVSLPLLMGVFVAVFTGPQFGVAGLAVVWLLHTVVVAALDVGLGGHGPRRATVIALAVTLLAGVGTVAVASRGWIEAGPLTWGLVDGALLAVLSALAGAVATRRTAEAPLGG